MTDKQNQGWNLENTYQQLPDLFYTNVKPVKADAPELVIYNETLAAELGLDSSALKDEAEIFAGNKLSDGSDPIAQAYAGHQFGSFTMLGDGRAVLFGEQLTPNGKRYDIQLKGSGRTPYSRGGDGRAVLGPMLREYLISEAMHGLGIPTSRSLAVAATGETVLREAPMPGAVLTRVAKSHIRVGTFQYARQWGSKEDLQALADYSIKRHYPEIEADKDRYLTFLYKVADKQAALIADWQLKGFIHGVMNTDNVAISGETIDYGPCAFMDQYDRKTVFSSIDQQGRYSYGNQPGIGAWNMARFAESLLILMNEDEEQAIPKAKEAVETYVQSVEDYWLEGMRQKVGIVDKSDNDKTLIQNLLDLMEKYRADFNNTFRSLTLQQLDADSALFQSSAFKEWHQAWQDKLEKQSASLEDAYQLMKQHNPSIIPRNYLVEEVLAAAVEKGDYEPFRALLAALKDPYAYTEEQEKYAVNPPEQDYQTFCGT
ncbi:protein adenylyltransferase SelO [Oceanobacillus jeddahense]|uniref:Protein nucleotidyltransferase YdiU n=1 Tax=Oceanobacillus jeddahense TaxID=1462527 RepID=A0ABY5JW12_9BACI|nr:YdiU family protein [Oceanobacillus jeddahense]UUI04440.1 YdiU family protein [Oceanobacillus jeddahense]